MFVMWARVAEGDGNPFHSHSGDAVEETDVQWVQLGLQRASRPSSANCDSRKFFGTIEGRQDTRPPYSWLRVEVPREPFDRQSSGHETSCV